MARTEHSSIEAEVTLLTTAEGGRASPLILGGGAFYRPHLVVGDPTQRKVIIGPKGEGTEDYLGVQFRPTA